MGRIGGAAARRVLALLVLVALAAACGGGDAGEGGDAVAGGGDAATGGGDAATGGGDAATDGGDAATDGGDAATDGGDAATRGADPAGGELTTLRVGALPIVDTAPLYLGVEEGFFEEEGLTVEPQVIQGGAAAVPALVAGELDLTIGNYVSFILAASQGLDVRIVSEGSRGAPENTALLVAGDSEIVEPADVAGRTVAINTLQNISELAVKAALEEQGVAPDSYRFTELPFPDQGGALERGSIDVAFVPEPFVTLLTGSGARVLVDIWATEGLQELPLVGYAATGEYAEQNAEAIAGFVRAMDRATALARQEPERVAEVVPTYTRIPPEVAGQVVLPGFAAAPDVEEIQRNAELMTRYGLLDEPFDVGEIVVTE